jgi:cytochrome c553
MKNLYKGNKMRNSSFIKICALAALVATNGFAIESNQAKIYEAQCVKCHGTHGEGNPAKKGPAVNNKSIGDLQIAIMDLQGNMSINGGGSGDHDKMEHNLKSIEKKGYAISSFEMAQFMYNSFNLKAKKK